MRKSDALQLDQDPVFQRREWTVQRAGWWALTLFVAAAAVGLFGNGPLSRTRTAAPDGIVSLEYDRFARRGAALRLLFEHRQASAGRLEVRVDRGYVDGLRIARITPEPETIEIGTADVVFTFQVPRTGPMAIVIDAEPRRAGRLSAELRATGAPPLRLSQLIYF
jgi:hypothetical protein